MLDTINKDYKFLLTRLGEQTNTRGGPDKHRNLFDPEGSGAITFSTGKAIF